MKIENIFKRVRLLCCLALLTTGFQTLLSAADSTPFMQLSDTLLPEVSLGIERHAQGMRIAVKAEGFDANGADVSVDMGVQGARTVRLSSDRHAKRIPTAETNTVCYLFEIPELTLGGDQVRMAFSVSWASELLPQARLKQRFRHLGLGSVHGGLSQDSADWEPLDFKQWARWVSDRQQEIAIDFEQPLDGKATIVIEDKAGTRIRNLISGQFRQAGKHRIVWDGLDDAGEPVPPNEFVWRSISHPGITPEYQMEFVNAPGSNHGTFHAATHNSQYVILGTPVSEGGHQVVVLESDGTFVKGFVAPHGVGLRRIQVAANEQYIYAAYDGSVWGTKVDRSQPDWKVKQETSLVRFEIETGKLAYFDKGKHWPMLAEYEVGPGAGNGNDFNYALAGLSLLNGKLYLADRMRDVLLVLDPETGQVEQQFDLANTVALATDGSDLFSVTTEAEVRRINVEDGTSQTLFKVDFQPAGICVGTDGGFYLSDADEQVLRAFSSEGKLKQTIGQAGGIEPGAYNSMAFQNPQGITEFQGLLWVTEHDRWNPKRFTAWNVKTGAVEHEFFGPPNYGAQGASFDYQDENLWIGQGTLFKLDPEQQTAEPQSILGGKGGRRHVFYRQEGRTFVITSGKATYIQELTEEGVLRPLALFSSAHQYAYSEKWYPPQVFVDALLRDYPKLSIDIGKRGGIERLRPGQGYGMLWVDRNGDAEMQTEEIEFATTADNLGGSAWSHDFNSLTLRVPGVVDGQGVLVTLEPDGWWPGGAPKYPALNDAVKAAVPIDLKSGTYRSTAVDRFGNLIVNSSPMMAYSPEGKTLWSFPNNWAGVHGSHRAPLPKVGELQGVLFYSGVVPLDDESDVMLMNGNHGRAFLMTSDGLYLDEMFPDVRMMTNPFAGGIGILGGECFGGHFGRSEKTGKYYFQGGGFCYRIYEVEGLDQMVRQQGSLTMSVEQAVASERVRASKVAEASVSKIAEIAYLASAPAVDGKSDDWSEVPTAEWTQDKKFPVSVWAGYDATHLYLYYVVRDESPWRNQGEDWQALFKTGDSIDLQLSTDTTAASNRQEPVPGDLRLLIAPSAEGDQVVLYRHREPGAPEDSSVIFQSPWRSEKVDVVKRISAAEVAVQKYSNRYELEAAIPLSEITSVDLSGLSLLGDFGVIYGDADGHMNIFRNYWSNAATGLVNDVPGEIMLNPSLWSEIRFKTNDDE